jgi:S1-C subfamily serine protease
MNIALALLLVLSQDDELKKVLELQEKVRACCEKVRPAYVFFGNGSGVCISADGWVLTNFHVSGDRSGQAVRMTGGQRFTADVVGFDPHGDIALCRIKNAKDLPFLDLGDSDGLRVGQHVIAMGNPFLLGNGSWEPTITFGIVSALHRYMDNPGYFDAIQTDAQINPGNSGGPLITLDGKVVGINGRIDIKRFMNRVNTGIGYAIPSKQIQRYLKKFKEGGEVKEGYIDGIRVGECGDSRYEKTGEYGDGVFVAGITQETPGAKAGFANGDIIFEIEGYRIHNLNRFHGVVSNWPQGETLKVKVRRGVAEVVLPVLLGDPTRVKPKELAASPVDLGFSPSQDYDDLGVEVEKIEKGGAAEKAGLKAGDVIKKLDGRRVKNWDEFRNTVQSRKPGDTLKLAVLRDGEELEIPVKIPAKKTDE